MNAVPERWQAVYSLNPMVGVIEAFRWALLSQSNFPATALVASAVVSTLLFVTGLFYFRRMEKTFADVV
jgi:lipopolysaccharide transport system permease protein